jgi:selenide,water dikinase
MSPAELGQLLERLPEFRHPNVLLGTHPADDAGVYLLQPDLALVQTVDFFTPIVDDPYAYGQIAAANALSDVYAMGATPVCALNIVGFHRKHFDLDVLVEILRGGAEKAAEAGVPILGGHTIQDEELKYGLAVTGVVHPDRVVAKAGARPGDHLVLTKPIGTGIATTALKAGRDLGDLLGEVIASMSALNRTASELMLAFDVHAATDITGFGLLGHSYEMASASGVSLRFYFEEVPRFPGVLELAADGYVPGGTANNRLYLQERVIFEEKLSWEEETLLFDAQTSGGLLIACPADRAEELAEELRRRGISLARVIGEVIDQSPPRIFVRRGKPTAFE